MYFVLFFPGVSAFPMIGASMEVITFSLVRELGRTITYTIPSFALLWYIISDKKGFEALVEQKPVLRDFIPFAAGLPGLAIIGIGISFLVTLLPAGGMLTPPPKIDSPADMAGYTVMVITCLGTGYLEESFFRFYLLSKFEDHFPHPLFGIILSSIMFSACHMYEGPWGIINSTLAGIFLSILFIKYRSLNGIAWAHAAYNILVYVSGNFI